MLNNVALRVCKMYSLWNKTLYVLQRYLEQLESLAYSNQLNTNTIKRVNYLAYKNLLRLQILSNYLKCTN